MVVWERGRWGGKERGMGMGMGVVRHDKVGDDAGSEKGGECFEGLEGGFFDCLGREWC